jgi:uncharacterized protein YbjT (DUF2867 family)
MIVVTGGTGRVGGQVVAQLRERDLPVRVVSRNPDGTDAVRADLADPASLEPHLRDAEALFLVWPFGAAARSLIDERDIAAVAVRALTEDGHAGARYLLSGPAVLTQAEQLAAIGRALGRDLTWAELSRPVAQQALAEAWGDPGFAASALDTWERFVTHPETVTSTVRDVTGAPAHPFAEWAAAHAGAFG